MFDKDAFLRKNYPIAHAWKTGNYQTLTGGSGTVYQFNTPKGPLELDQNGVNQHIAQAQTRELELALGLSRTTDIALELMQAKALGVREVGAPLAKAEKIIDNSAKYLASTSC